MKSTLKKIFLLTLSVLFITGCKKNFVNNEKQVILFQLEHINYAWGYQHNGFIIDKEGNVLTYSNPEDWNFPDNDFVLTKKNVDGNINKCTQTSIKIPREELQKYSNYIKNIALSKVTAKKNVGADAGSVEYICYQFSESTGTYKGSLIKMEGDYTCENLNFYSKKIVTWMKEINTSIARN